MAPPGFHRQLWSALRGWWREQSRQKGAAAASALLVHELWIFLRDFHSRTPSAPLWRHGVRLGTSRQYDQRDRRLARAPAGSVSLPLSAHRPSCCAQIESICADARDFEPPPEPLVLYLFNPMPEEGLRQMLANLESSLRQHPRTVYVLYQTPLLEHVRAGSEALRKSGGTGQYTVYSNAR